MNDSISDKLSEVTDIYSHTLTVPSKFYSKILISFKVYYSSNNSIYLFKH